MTTGLLPAHLSAASHVSPRPVARVVHPTKPPGDQTPVAVAVSVVGLGFWLMGCAQSNPRNADGWGLASTLTWPVWVGIIMTVGSVVVGIGQRANRPAMGVMTFILAIELYGLPPIVEALPRTTTAWLHLGFVDHFAVTGESARGIDSRFSWPGFFSWWGMLSEAGAGDRMVTVANWTPVFVAAVTAVLTGQLALAFGVSRQGARLATVLFLLLNWIEQDYFSPQATAYVMALSLLVLTLKAAGGNLRARVATLLAGPPVILAVVVTHQLTPAMIGVQLLAVLGCRVARVRPLLWTLVVAELTWFVVGAHEFWGGQQLALLTGGLGNVGASVGSNLTARITALDPGLAMVRHLRLIIFAFTLVLAGLGMVARRNAGRTVLLPFFLVAAPAATVVQGYGGEMFMRCALFALPALCVLGAEALLMASVHRFRMVRALPFVVAALAAPVLVVLRGGNDSFSYVSPAEVRLVAAAVNATAPTETLLLAEEQGPVRTSRVREIQWRNVSALCRSNEVDDAVPSISKCARRYQPSTIVVTKSMQRWGEIAAGRPPDWAARQVRELILAREYKVLARNEDGVVLRKIVRPKGRVARHDRHP